MMQAIYGFIGGMALTAIVFVVSGKFTPSGAPVSEEEGAYVPTKSFRQVAASGAEGLAPQHTMPDLFSVDFEKGLAESLHSLQSFSLAQITALTSSPDFNNQRFFTTKEELYVESVFNRYAELDPEGALEFALQWKHPERRSALFAVFRQYARQNPESALASLQEVEDERDLGRSVNGIVVGVGQYDPTEALQISEEYADGRYNNIAAFYLAKDSPEEALEVLTGGRGSRYIESGILGQWVLDAPEEVSEWVAGLEEDEQEYYSRRVSKMLGSYNREEAEAWMKEHPYSEREERD